MKKCGTKSFRIFHMIFALTIIYSSQDCELIRQFDSLKMLIKTKKNISC